MKKKPRPNLSIRNLWAYQRRMSRNLPLAFKRLLCWPRPMLNLKITWCLIKKKNERIRENQNTYNPEVLKHSLFTTTSALLKSVEKPWLSKDQILNKKIKLIKNLNLLDADWYNTVNQDVKDAGMDPVAHYILHGLAEGRDPIPVPPRIVD